MVGRALERGEAGGGDAEGHAGKEAGIVAFGAGGEDGEDLGVVDGGGGRGGEVEAGAGDAEAG